MELDVKCHLCKSKLSKFLISIESKPEGETFYGINEQEYYREIHQCENCSVFFNVRYDKLIPDDFYQGKYNESIKLGSIARRFSKIIEFSYKESDNKNRVLRIVNHLYKENRSPVDMSVLDVGAGTCVFLHEMKKFGFQTSCVDPDPSSIRHSIDIVNVDAAYIGSIDSIPTDQKFDLITFNKVLEHVKKPINILSKASKYLKANGIIYVELPDGTEIDIKGEFRDRAEFYIDHHTIFNKNSYLYLCRKSGFTCEGVHQIIDPSGKYTIYGFLKKNKDNE